ncbi:glycosyltransferase [Aetokthonos hydrillicola Thurmond2011]|uniref:Glycosyltransferase n=3 Tax=Aetokthonos TaxID=1550243 RepID=A0AAP5IAL2_9CYAN|nr:glycosyltransferase [Aetokthonos hydrillicola]MDR9897704.1 glycosyltransferase [Aetokthonos hydrillicola Thurmond2011]
MKSSKSPATYSTNSKPFYALLSVDSDPSLKIGKQGACGKNIYVRELGIALAKRGCQVDIFTRTEDSKQEEILELTPGCNVIRLTAGPKKFITKNDVFEYLPKFVEAWLDFQQRTGRKYALIHTNYWLSGWVGLQLKHRLRLPQVHTYHSIGAVKYRNVENPPKIAVIRHGVELACLEQADCVITTSPQQAEDLRELISQHGRIQVIPFGINTDRFSMVTQELARQQLEIPPDIRIILYVGCFDANEGIETLVKACTKLPQPYKLYLVVSSLESVVDCQEQQRIRALVNQLGLEEVTLFIGDCSHEQLPAYYAAANVCVVPTHYETNGLVAIEAMASGTPVIASDVGELQHTVVHGTTGLLVPPGDSDTLALTIWNVFENPEIWKSYGTSGRSWVQSYFSCQAVASQVHKLYQSLTFSTVVQELITSKNFASNLENYIHKLLESRALNSHEIDDLEQLVESLSEGLIT